ncbi:MAG: VCBS repeat-containing protein [Pirellulales bacterium]
MNRAAASRKITLAVSLALFSFPLSRTVVRADDADAVQRAADLAEPVRLIDADHPVAAPFVADVDGDGAAELLVGEYRRAAYTEAGFRVYHRIGKPSDLKFDAGNWLQAAGRDATVPAFCYTGSAPQVVDFNGDGIPDVVSQAMTGNRDEAVLRVFPGEGKGRFGEPTDVTYLTVTKSSPRLTCYNVRAFVYDWDGDGNPDVLATYIGGRGIWLVRHSGDRGKNSYSAPEALEVDGDALRGGKSICMADWDGDGRDDLIVGNDGVQWYRNMSPRGEPKLAAGVTLIPPGKFSSVRYSQSEQYPPPQAPSGPLRVCVADVTGDGRMDLIVGDVAGATAVGPTPTKEQTLALEAAWRRMTVARDAYYKLKSADPPTTAEARVLYDGNLELRRAECSAIDREIEQLKPERYERHGSVWLFRRLAK